MTTMPSATTWRRIALSLLVLNLFLLALIGGHLWRTAPNSTPPIGSTLASALANAEATLSSEDAAKFHAAISQDAPQYADALQQAIKARAELERQVTADPFDPAAMQDAFKAWEMSWVRFMDAFRVPITKALGEVSPEGRRRLVEQRHQVLSGSK